MIPSKSNKLLLEALSDDFYYVVNPWFPNSLKVINSIQKKILDEIDGFKSIQDIAGNLQIEDQSLMIFLDSLSKKEIISFSNKFSSVQLPTAPKSLNLWIHTTNKCNLACSYCYISTLNSTGGMTESVQQQLIAQLLRTAKAKGLTSIKLRLAGGEPLSNFNSWKKFIEASYTAFEKESCNFSISFLSNLTILNNGIIDFVKKYNIHFGISLDGFESYNDITRKNLSGRGTFETIDKNINKLKANGINFSISSVVTNLNMKGLPELTDYLIKKNVNFRYSIVRGEDIDRNELSNYLSKSYEIMEEAIETGWKFKQNHRLNDLKPSDLGVQTCSSGFSGGAVYVDGGVYYCHVQFGTGLGKNGTIFDNSKDILDLIKIGSVNEGYKSKDCETCNYKNVCTSGCPMYRVDGKDPNCSLYHEFIPKIYRLQAKERLYMILKK